MTPLDRLRELLLEILEQAEAEKPSAAAAKPSKSRARRPKSRPKNTKKGTGKR